MFILLFIALLPIKLARARAFLAIAAGSLEWISHYVIIAIITGGGGGFVWVTTKVEKLLILFEAVIVLWQIIIMVSMIIIFLYWTLFLFGFVLLVFLDGWKRGFRGQIFDCSMV